jgi:ATPase subunit of ABC transporter with duplicated ATPase domains
VLDEPTNDLDINTLRALEGLDNFAGCAVVISRQWFLDRICTHIAFEGNLMYYFEGGFSEYEENKKTFRWRLNTKTFEIQKTNQKLILVL